MSMTDRVAAWSAALALAGTLSVAARASDMPPAHEAAEDAARTVPGAASKGVKACHDDIESFCAKVKPGAGRLGRCLERNRKQLSPACRTFILHGGKAHSSKAFQEIDRYVLALSTPAVTPSTAPVRAP